MLILALFAVPALFAVGSGNGVLRNGAMDGVMADVICKTNFNVGVLESYKSAIPNSSSVLESLIVKLESDTSTLQSYANSNNTESFRLFLKDNYEKDSKDARESLLRIRRNASLDNSTKESLRSQYDSLKTEYQNCHTAAVRLFASAKADLYEDHLEKLDEKIRTLEDKGVDSSKLRSLVAQARLQIVNPLKNAINSSNSSALVKAATREFCLYNGCNNGTSFHLAARFEIEKLQTLLNRLSLTNSSEISDLIEDAQNDLDEAKEILETYSSSRDSESKIWSEIRSAASTIQKIIREINENKGQERREEVRDRVQEIRNNTIERSREIRNESRERIESIRNATRDRIEDRLERMNETRRGSNNSSDDSSDDSDSRSSTDDGDDSSDDSDSRSSSGRGFDD